jgi:hypothetical protein
LVFLSYINEDSDFVSEVADALPDHGLTGFVARRDVPPSKEWLREVEQALLRCNALAAFLRPGFRESQWTDQEVGYALGRQRKTLPLRRSKDVLPHGFLNRYMAVEIEGQSASEVAGTIFDALLVYEDERPPLIDVSLRRLGAERDPLMLKRCLARLRMVRSLSAAQQQELLRALHTNLMLKEHPAFKEAREQLVRRLIVPEVTEVE